VLEVVDEFVRMREITGSVKVAVKCLIAVVLPYWTSKVEHLVVYAAIVSNILLRMRRNGYLETSAKSFGDLVTFSVDFFSILYAECNSIPRYRFDYKVQNFGDLETFPLILPRDDMHPRY